jgi:hypothetical protein
MSSATGIATLDFGTGSNEASVAVTGQASILATSKCDSWVMADDSTASHSAGDHRFFAALTGLTCGTPTTATGFTIYATSIHDLTGTFQVRWVWVD